MDKKVKILDTNVLLDYPQIVTKEDEYWIIPMCVLREIDDLKKNPNHETAQKARKAAVYISKNMDFIEFIPYDSSDKADDQLLEITKERNGILITNDVSLKVRAKVKGIETEGYSWDEDYCGIVYLNVSELTDDEYDNILADLWENGHYEPDDYTFSTNEYLIVPPPHEDATFGEVSIFKFNGTKFQKVIGKEIENGWCGKIFPRNPEQYCLVDALLDDNIKIIYAGGHFGTGKTFLTHNYAIRELEREKINKIIYVPNNSYTQNTMDLGALPGDLMEKILPSIGPLVDLVGIDQINRWIQEEKLEVVPVAYIRGRNFDKSIVLVSEAENLTEEHIKLLLARCGKDTKIFFDGDIHQADSAIFKDRNGLKLLLNLHNSPVFSRMFATTQLIRIERSIVAAAADYLDTV